MSINVTTNQIRHSREDFRITVEDPDLSYADQWLMTGCSREAAKQWHAETLRRLGITK